MNQTAFTKEFILQSKYPLPVRRFSVSEYQKMGETGILSEDEHIELIDGVIIQMSPKGSRHSAVLRQLAFQFYQLVIERKALLSVQDPVVLDDEAEPEPDLALVKIREDAYSESHPRPDDVLLLVEVSDTTLRYDKEVKLPHYAASGILEVWIVNLVDNIIEVYTEPILLANETAGYKRRNDFAKGDTLKPQAMTTLEITVDDVLI